MRSILLGHTLSTARAVCARCGAVDVIEGAACSADGRTAGATPAGGPASLVLDALATGLLLAIVALPLAVTVAVQVAEHVEDAVRALRRRVRGAAGQVEADVGDMGRAADDPENVDVVCGEGR